MDRALHLPGVAGESVSSGDGRRRDRLCTICAGYGKTRARGEQQVLRAPKMRSPRWAGARDTRSAAESCPAGSVRLATRDRARRNSQPIVAGENGRLSLAELPHYTGQRRVSPRLTASLRERGPKGRSRSGIATSTRRADRRPAPGPAPRSPRPGPRAVGRTGNIAQADDRKLATRDCAVAGKSSSRSTGCGRSYRRRTPAAPYQPARGDHRRCDRAPRFIRATRFEHRLLFRDSSQQSRSAVSAGGRPAGRRARGAIQVRLGARAPEQQATGLAR